MISFILTDRVLETVFWLWNIREHWAVERAWYASFHWIIHSYTYGLSLTPHSPQVGWNLLQASGIFASRISTMRRSLLRLILCCCSVYKCTKIFFLLPKLFIPSQRQHRLPILFFIFPFWSPGVCTTMLIITLSFFETHEKGKTFSENWDPN